MGTQLAHGSIIIALSLAITALLKCMKGIHVLQDTSSGKTYRKAASLSDDDITKLFPFLGRDLHTTVNPDDVLIGHQWKTYIFPIPAIFNELALQHYTKRKSGLDCWTKSCNATTMAEGYAIKGHFIDYHAEVIIFKKLLSSLHFVKDIEDADLVWVPILGVSTIIFGNNIGSCSKLIECQEAFLPGNIAVQMEKMSEISKSKKQLFLASRDFSRNPSFITEQHTKHDNVVVSYGPQGIVVPSLNSEESFQPSNWKGCKPMHDRHYFLVANIGVRAWLLDRHEILKQLNEYKGSKWIVRQTTFEGTSDKLSDSIMTLCPPGDLPFQKRFYDSILACSIPVVIKRNVEEIKTYWSNVNYGFGIGPFSVNESYPALPFPYEDIVVEIDGSVLAAGKMMEYLEGIPQSILESKLEKLGQIRNRFVYDFNGTVPDAFTVMLTGMASQIL